MISVASTPVESNSGTNVGTGRGLITLALALSALLAFVSPASASQTHRFERYLPEALTASFTGLTVDQSNGDVYEVTGLSSGMKISRFDGAGNPAPFSFSSSYISGNQITGTPSGGFTLLGSIAVTPPGSPSGTAGDLFVIAERFGENSTVLVYAPNGKYLGQITEADGHEFPRITDQELCGLTAGPEGALYIAEAGGAVDKFVPQSNPPTNADFDSRISGLPGQRCALASSASVLYAGGEARAGRTFSYPLSLFPGGGGEVDASALGTEVRVGGLPVVSSSLAVDPATEDLYFDGESEEPLAASLGNGEWSSTSALAVGSESVSCPEAGFCMAAGEGPGAVAYEAGEAKQLEPPKPPGATSAMLRRVSCASADSCMAVGWWREGAAQTPFAESWDGSAWSLVSVPVPADAEGPATPTGVSCPSASSCELVGHYVSALNANGGPSQEKALAESWDGSTWTVQAASPTGRPFAALNAVSCSAPGTCTAVGNSRPDFGTAESHTLAERLEGSTWTLQATVDVEGENSLEDVSCAAADACMAVGLTKSGPAQGAWSGITEGWDGSQWSISEHGSQKATFHERFYGVSCATAMSCVAVGDTDSQSAPLIESWDGSTWAKQIPPSPVPKAPLLAGVSCPSTGSCLAVGRRAGARQIAQLDSTGATVSFFGGVQMTEARSRSIAVDSSQGASSARHVYAQAEEGKVAVFGPQIAVADPVTKAASDVGGAGATLNGAVNPDGVPLTECKFEYGPTTSYGQSVACEEPGYSEVGSGHEPKPVRARITDLNGGTEYHYRLVVANGNGPSEDADQEFTTEGPRIDATSASHVGDASARLEGLINPDGMASEYVFQYIEEAQFLATGFDEATEAPTGGATIGEGVKDVNVAQEVFGLAPLSTYRYRLVATSAAGVNVGPTEVLTTYPSSPPVSTDCGNEAVRTLSPPSLALPDCRAYEQASPVQKNGTSAQAEPNAAEAAADGEGVVFYSNGGIPGGEGSQEFPNYLANRTVDGSGWTTQGLLPPASTGGNPNAKVLGWDEELSSAFDINQAPGGLPTLYRRDNASGRLAPLATGEEEGSSTSFHYADADTAGDRVLFENVGEQVAPGAEAGASNVYLWDSTAGVRVAGALNDGKAPPGGAVAGPYAWYLAGPGGGAASKYYTQAEHVLSDDGSAAFFTALGTKQVYERLNPVQPQSKMSGGKCNQPQAACTIQISASQKSNGEGAGGTDPNGPQPAVFVGASPDAGSALLMSSEELTEDANTGAVDVSRANLDGSSAEASFLPAYADAIATDGTHIYWANPAAGTIGRAALDGSSSEPHFITGADHPAGVAVDSGHVYWTNDGNGENGQGSIGRANLDGSEANQAFITGASNPQGIVVSATAVFWANAGSTEGTRRISRTNLDGKGLIAGLVTVTGASGPSGLTLQGESIYWANPGNNSIGQAKVDGTEVKPAIVNGAAAPRGLAAAEGHLFWVNSSTGAIGRSELDGSSPEQNLLTNISGAHAVAADASHLYWSSNAGDKGNDLYRYQAASRTLTDLTADAFDPSGAQVKGVLGTSTDQSWVYFAAAGHLTLDAPPANCTGTGEETKGLCNLYLWHEGAITYVTQLEAVQSSDDRSDTLNWTPTAGLSAGRTRSNTARVTPDGRTIVFRSTQRLTGYDNKGFTEFYRYVVGQGAPSCVSCNPSGAAPFGDTLLQALPLRLLGPKNPTAVLTRNLSADGQRFFFTTSNKLVVGDVNGEAGCPFYEDEAFYCDDVYEWEAPGSGSCHSANQNGGCIYLISTGTSADPSYFVDAGNSGRDAFFITTQPLVGQDEDALVDVYDAREGGGIAAQSPPPASSCEGEACKSSPPVASVTSNAGTATFSGQGNVATLRASCPKGEKKSRRHGKGRCQKAPRHRHAHKKRHGHKRTRRHDRNGGQG